MHVCRSCTSVLPISVLQCMLASPYENGSLAYIHFCGNPYECGFLYIEFKAGPGWALMTTEC